MAKSSVVATRPGEVKETVIQERIVPPEEVGSPASGMDPFDYMNSLSESDWTDHIVYLYRKYPPPPDGTKASYITKFSHTFDEEWIRDKADVVMSGATIGQGFGGGTFHYILKKGSQRLKEGDISVAGPPRDWNGNMPGGAGRSDLVEIVRMLKEGGVNGQGGSPSDQLMKSAMINALEIQKAAILSNQMSPAQMMEMVVKLRGEQKPSEMPDWMKQVLAATIPALATGLVGVITKSLAPQDAMASLKSLGEAMSVLKTMGGEPSAPDIGVELLRSGPMLLGQVGNVLEKLNQAQQMRLATARLPGAPSSAAPESTAVAPGIPSDRPAASHRNVPTSAVAAQVQAEMRQAPVPGTPQFQAWLADRIVQMVSAGDDGKFVHDWLDVADPDTVKWLRAQNFTLEQFEQLLATGLAGQSPKLAELATLPNFKQFVMEFYATLMAGGESAPAAA